jgi:hypothetical protein
MCQKQHGCGAGSTSSGSHPRWPQVRIKLVQVAISGHIIKQQLTFQTAKLECKLTCMMLGCDTVVNTAISSASFIACRSC